MITPLFSVNLNGGGFESAFEYSVFITSDQSAAQTYVDYMNAVYESMRRKIALTFEEDLAWVRNNPVPEVADTPLLSIPKWGPIIGTITLEMRDERAAQKEENARRIAIVRAPVIDWHTRRLNILAERRDTLLTEAEKKAWEEDDVFYYSVVALEWMPPLATLMS